MSHDVKGPILVEMRKEKRPNSPDTSDDHHSRNVYMQCTGNLHTINMATEYQQAIKEEMKKFSKLERAVSQKKNFQAERLTSLVESKGGRSNTAGAAYWFDESVQSMVKQLVQQAQSHVYKTDALAKQCAHIQAFLDSHQEVMNSLHEAEVESANATGAQNNTSSIPRPRSPRKNITAPERRQDGVACASDTSKWYISPPPLTPPRHRNQSGPMADFRRACIKYEAIRKSRMMLDNRVEYLLMQQKSIMNQLNEATGLMAGLPGVGNGKMSAWTTQSKLEDLRSRQDFLRNQKEQTEREIREARKEMKEFDGSQSNEMDQILVVFESTKERYEHFLKQSLSVLKTAISSDSVYQSSEQSDPQHNDNKYTSKTNAWETFEDQTHMSSRENLTTVRQDRSPELPVLKPLKGVRSLLSPPQHADLMLATLRSSPVDPAPHVSYPKTTCFQEDVNPVTGYWDDTINDTLHCGEDSSISEIETAANNTTCFEGQVPNTSTSVDATKWLFGSSNPSLVALADLGKQVMKDEYITRRFSLQSTCPEKQPLSIGASNNKTNNRNVEISNSDLRSESSDQLKNKIERSNVVVLRSKTSGKTSDAAVHPDGTKKNESSQSQNEKQCGEETKDKVSILSPDDPDIPQKKNEEERNIKMYIGKYLKCLKNAEPHALARGDNNTNIQYQQGMWKGGEPFLSQHSPIAITVSKESRRQLRVCTVHPISPSSENICREDIASCNSTRRDQPSASQCKFSCRQESRTQGPHQNEERMLSLTDGESTGIFHCGRESGDNIEECHSENEEESTKSSKSSSSLKQHGCPDCKKKKGDKCAKVSSSKEEEPTLRKDVTCDEHRSTVAKYENENRESATVDDLQLTERSRDSDSRYDEDCEVKDIMTSLYAQNVMSIPGFETYNASERERMNDSTPRNTPTPTRDVKQSSNETVGVTVSSDSVCTSQKKTEQRHSIVEKRCVQNNIGECTTSISRNMTNSFITLSTRKTKTMVFNTQDSLDSAYNLDNSDDSESESLSLTASLTCSSSIYDHNNTVPILTRPGSEPRNFRKGKKRDKNVRFNEEVQYNTFIDSEDRRNDYGQQEDGENGEDNGDREDSEGNGDEEDEDSDTFPLMD